MVLSVVVSFAGGGLFRFSVEYGRMSVANATTFVEKSSAATWCTLNADVPLPGGAPLPNGPIGGTWDVLEINGGALGCNITTGGILSFTEPGIYEVSFQVQALIGETLTATNNNGQTLALLVPTGSSPLNDIQLKASQFVNATGTVTIQQQAMWNAYGYIDVVDPVGLTLVPFLGTPPGGQTVGNGAINQKATYIIVKRVV